jgi:hypothetical protein
MGKPHRRTTVAIVYGNDGEPIAVLCDPASDPPGQRWFSVVLEDATGPDGPHEVPVCVDCLLDTHPGLGQGLDVALEHTGAAWDGEAWQPAPELWD